jgi:hypothetical protein
MTKIRALALAGLAVVAFAGCKSTSKGTAATTTTAAASVSAPSSSAPSTTAKSTQASGSGTAADDVTIGACTNDPTIDIGSAQVTITNHTSKASNYIVEVTANSPDGKTQIDSGTAAANNLAPGQSTTQTAQFSKSIPAGSVCKAANVTRYAS